VFEGESGSTGLRREERRVWYGVDDLAAVNAFWSTDPRVRATHALRRGGMMVDGEQSFATSVDRMMDAFRAGKLEDVMGFWSQDAVMHVPRKHRLSGSFRGRDEIGRAITRFGELSGWTLDLEPTDVLSGAGYGVVLFRATAEHAGRRLDVIDASAFRMDSEGRFAECWWLPDDQAAFDAFWK
jgi:ketosteroid isomerase-like protein